MMASSLDKTVTNQDSIRPDSENVQMIIAAGRRSFTDVA